ncbi:hypothetical protein K4A83_01690 [Spirulina subsalsa FACHB-351]|uniref:Uncharacterized protein n=1 Tax=Spirulina subsalsa FACHB-351 TaxID=234711 RepID=A0ABT3L0G1_9CYAN|nr:hypothetical protein [Spirulina subsalsa]MCW6034987.1 hypothetical protein [Spirulina subsalsa FACHB-351]
MPNLDKDVPNLNKDANDQAQLLAQLQNKELLIVNSRRKNGLIIYKRYHAEFAGPGSVVGSVFDLDAIGVLPVGNWSLVPPKNAEERHRAYLIRRQWIKLVRQITVNPAPLQRAQIILNQFENWFDEETVSCVPDEAFARLVGVLPQTMIRGRRADARL